MTVRPLLPAERVEAKLRAAERRGYVVALVLACVIAGLVVALGGL